MLQYLIRSKAEIAVLGIVLFSEDLHLREIARRAGVSPPESKRELDYLVKLGLLNKSIKGNMSIYSLNPICPFLLEIKGLYLKTEGAVPILKKGLLTLHGVRYAFVYGSTARGSFTEKSDLDLLVIGEVNHNELDKLCFEVQRKTGKETNYILWNLTDFKKKILDKGAFLSSLLKNEKIWLAGEENEFKRVVKEKRN